EVTPWVFQQVDGQERVVFRPKGDGMVMLIASTPVYAYTRVAWYDAPTAHGLLVVVCVLLFLSALLWPLGFVLWVIRRHARSRKVGRGVFKGRSFLNHAEKLWDRVGAGVVRGFQG